MPTMEVMPITTPRTVKPERSLLDRTVSNAIVTTSPKSAARMATATASFPSQGFDRVEPCRLHRRVEAEEQADQRRDADAEHDRPRLNRRRNRREVRDP